MAYVWAVLVVAIFAVTVERLRLPDRAREVARRSSECLEITRDPTLRDAAKEERLQRQATSLFRLFGILTGGSLLAIGLPLGAIWILDVMGLASLGPVLAVLERIDFLAAVTVVGGVIYLSIRRQDGT